jgi:hypothetical protein
MHSSIEASVLSSTGKLSPYLWVEQHTVTYNVKINIVLKFVEELLQMEDDPVPNYLPSSTRGRHDCEQGGTCSYEPTSLDTRLAVDPTPSSSTAYCHAHSHPSGHIAFVERRRKNTTLHCTHDLTGNRLALR